MNPKRPTPKQPNKPKPPAKPVPAPLSDDLFEVELTAMAYGGSALGKHGKQTVFIPYTLPGERVMAKLTQDKGRIAFAEGVKLLDASSDRVYPQCPHFGPRRCGGCQWQHIHYNAQVLLKQDVLNDQLARIGEFDDATIERVVQPVIPSPQQWGYNQRITFQVTENGAFGLPGAVSSVQPYMIETCHILHPDLLALFNQLDLDTTGITQMILQQGSDGERMVILSVAQEDDAPELLIDMPISVNLLLPEDEPINLVGDLCSRYRISSKLLRVSAGSAFRGNIAQIETLVQEVLMALALSGNETVLDLYAGVGLFSVFIADHVNRLTLIERYPPAAHDADQNLQAHQHVDVIQGAVEDVLPTLDTPSPYHAAVLDPPSEGLSLDALDRLVALKIPRLVYVSSDLATFARDARRLGVQGYDLARVQPIDFAPQTYHTEVVATFIMRT